TKKKTSIAKSSEQDQGKEVDVPKAAAPYAPQSKDSAANEKRTSQSHSSPLREEARPTARPKLVIPKLTDINLATQIPNLNTVFDEKENEGSSNKDPQYIQGEGEEPF